MIHMRMRHDNVGNACIRRRVEQCLEVSVVIGARVYDRNPVHAEKIRLRTGKRHWSRIWCRDNPEAGCEFQGDADLNLVDSIRVAASPESRDKGVLVVLNNQIHASRDVAKSHATRLETFASADFGALGMISADHQVAFYRGPQRSHTSHTEFDVSDVDDLERVDIVAAYLGADGTMVRAAVSAGAEGIVISGLGAGYSTPSIMEAVKEATGNGVVVALSSQASGGRVAMTRGFKDAGVVVADNLSPKKARILLMLALTVTKDVDRIQRMMAKY